MTTSRNENYQRRINLPIFGPITIRDLSLAAGLAFGVLGVLLTVASIYLTLRDPEARVTFKIISATDVLDLRRSLDDLRIEFRGQDLQEQDLNLKVVKISVENTGETHIRSGDYSNADWGIRVIGGQIIEAKVDQSDAANSILTKDLRYVGRDSIGFPKIVFDKGDTFAIELLVLHPNLGEPVVEPIGKIAGVETFGLAPVPQPNREVGLIGQALGGGVGVLYLRSGVYFVGSVVTFIGALFALFGVLDLVDWFRAWRRKKRVSQTNGIRRIDSVSVRDHLIDLYSSTGLTGLRKLCDIVAEPDAIRWMEHSSEWLISDQTRTTDDESLARTFDAENWRSFQSARAALLAMGLLEKGENGEAMIDPNIIRELQNIVRELEDKDH